MLFFILGKTSTGKGLIAKYLKDKYGIPEVVSYTTRPMRSYETNGLEHYFIAEEEMKHKVESENLIAYTRNEITGVEYCSTLECMTNLDMVYIINPDGIYWFEKFGSSYPYKVIYVNCTDDIIIERGIARGDDVEVLRTRLSSEAEEFDNFYNDKGYDYCINNLTSVDYLYGQIDVFMEFLGYEKTLR